MKSIEIFAHRGVHSQEVGENTLPAFKDAIDFKVDGIEFDVRLSADNKCVLVHDSKTANKKRIAFSKWPDLHLYDENICTLEEALQALAAYRGVINIEIKHLFFERGYRRGRECVKQIVNVLLDLYENVEVIPANILISSFSFKNLLLIKKLIPNIQVAYLFPYSLTSIYWKRRTKLVNANSIHLSVGQMRIFGSNRFIEQAHKRNLKVRCYTVNDIKTLQNLQAKNIDGVFTDKVKLIQEYI